MSLEDSRRAPVEPIALSRRQKRDLIELVAAGVMSAVFFTAPVVLLRHTLEMKPGPAPAPAVATKAAPARMAPLESVQVVTMDVAVPVSSPELAATPAVVHAVRWNAPPRSPRSAPLVASRPPRPTLGRRIARLFAGDGTHTVQPFPGVPATQRWADINDPAGLASATMPGMPIGDDDVRHFPVRTDKASGPWLAFSPIVPPLQHSPRHD